MNMYAPSAATSAPTIIVLPGMAANSGMSTRNFCAMNWYESGNGDSVLPSRMTIVMPRKMSMPASVTMNDGTRTNAIQKPCQAPTSRPNARQTATVSGTDMP